MLGLVEQKGNVHCVHFFLILFGDQALKISLHPYEGRENLSIFRDRDHKRLFTIRVDAGVQELVGQYIARGSLIRALPWYVQITQTGKIFYIREIAKENIFLSVGPFSVTSLCSLSVTYHRFQNLRVSHPFFHPTNPLTIMKVIFEARKGFPL